jgi:hypothetical protein
MWALVGQSPAVCAQDRVTVQSRNVVIVRSGEIVRDFPERKRARVRYPIVLGLSNSSVLRRVQRTLAIKNVFGMSLEEYRRDDGLENFDYKINYNKNYLLDITFQHSGMGAYPSTETRHFLINLKNGMIIKAADAFRAEALATLPAMANQKLKAETKELAKVVADDKELDAEQKASLKEQLEQLTFTVDSLNQFSVSDKGLTFLYDAGFPHVIQALQPNGEYFFTYAEVRSYIKPTGPLGIFR